MKKRLVLMIFLMLLLVGCSPTAKTITPAVAKQMLEENSEVVLVDVRELWEYQESRIPGAILLSLANIPTMAEDVLPDKKATYIIYCRTGRRSKEAVDLLVEMGYKSIYDLGGIVDWSYEIESG